MSLVVVYLKLLKTAAVRAALESGATWREALLFGNDAARVRWQAYQARLRPCFREVWVM